MWFSWCIGPKSGSSPGAPRARREVVQAAADHERRLALDERQRGDELLGGVRGAQTEVHVGLPGPPPERGGQRPGVAGRADPEHVGAADHERRVGRGVVAARRLFAVPGHPVTARVGVQLVAREVRLRRRGHERPEHPLQLPVGAQSAGRARRAWPSPPARSTRQSTVGDLVVTTKFSRTSRSSPLRPNVEARPPARRRSARRAG